jgi:hypothetical protein
MIAILLATARVAGGGLDVTARDRADPHVAICRRYGEFANAGDLGLVLKDLPARFRRMPGIRSST